MATAVPAAPPLSPFTVFRNRNFTLLWTGELVSTIGDSLMALAASILVYRQTGSALSVGLMLMATAAPGIVLGLIGGVFVDRYNRKTIMIAADTSRAALVILIPFLVPLNILWLYVIVALMSSISQFFAPALASVLPEVATDEELAAANSLMAISTFGSTAIGFAASGLLAAISIDTAFYLDAVSFLFSAACVALISLPRMVAQGRTTVATVFRNIREGMQFLQRTPILRSAIYLFPLFGISFGMWNSLLLPFARQALHATEFEYGIQEGLTSLGFVIGSLLMASVSGRLREGQWLALSFVSMGIINAIYSQLTAIPLAIVLVMVSGFSNAPSSIARGLLIQRNTPREVRGRVNSIFSLTKSVAFLIGMAAAGLADIWGVRQVVLLSALFVLVPGVLALFLPGLGQPAAEWRRAMHLLRTASATSGLTAGRAPTLADLDALAIRLPALSGLTAQERKDLISQGRIIDVPAGTTILHRGEMGDAAFFILSGRTIAGISTGEGQYRNLETMITGDFFGEIAALVGGPRNADVVAEEPTTVLQVPGLEFRRLMENVNLSRVVHEKFMQRLSTLHLGELPRFTGMDQKELLDLRTPQAEPAPA
jgi:CRP-like cAMP-binding protein